MFKVGSKSDKGGMIKIVDTKANIENWYFMTDEIKKVVININVGDFVEFQSSKDVPDMVGKQVLTQIKKVIPTKENTVEAPPIMKTDKDVTQDPRVAPKTFVPYGSKTPEESERISRLSIANSTSQAVSSLADHLDENTLPVVWGKMYDLIYKKVMTVNGL